jgi:repressor LexA
MRGGNEILTKRQAAVLQFIVDHLTAKGFPPTVAEIATEFKFASPNAAASHLNALRKKRFIEILPRASRGIRVVKNPSGTALGSSFAPCIPIVGRVAAGSPILAEQSIESSVAIDAGAFSRTPDYFLRVQGDSMIDAGIFEGDLIAVHRTHDVKNGEIVVARLDDDVTVKFLKGRGKKVELHPANARYKPIHVDKADRFEIEGVCVGLLRAI